MLNIFTGISERLNRHYDKRLSVFIDNMDPPEKHALYVNYFDRSSAVLV